MAWVADADFNGLTDGDLNGQAGGSGWSDNWGAANSVNATNFDVQGTTVYEGAKAVTATTAAANSVIARTLTTAVSGTGVFYFSFRRSSTSVAQFVFNARASGGTGRIGIVVNASGNIVGNGTTITAYSADVWWVLRITYDLTGNSYTVATSTDAFGTAGTFSAESSTCTMAGSGQDLAFVDIDRDLGAVSDYWDYISPTSPFAVVNGDFFALM